MRTPSGTLVSRFTMEVVTALVTGLLGAIVCYGSTEFGTGWGDAGPEPGYFPFYVGLITIFASLFNLVMAFKHHRDRVEEFLTGEQARRVLAFFGPMVLFVLVASYLGIYVGMILYLVGAMVFQGGYRLPKAAAVGVITAIANYFLFEVWFQVPLLKGPLEPLIGIH